MQKGRETTKAMEGCFKLNTKLIAPVHKSTSESMPHLSSVEEQRYAFLEQIIHYITMLHEVLKEIIDIRRNFNEEDAYKRLRNSRCVLECSLYSISFYDSLEEIATNVEDKCVETTVKYLKYLAITIESEATTIAERFKAHQLDVTNSSPIGGKVPRGKTAEKKSEEPDEILGTTALRQKNKLSDSNIVKKLGNIRMMLLSELRCCEKYMLLLKEDSLIKNILNVKSSDTDGDTSSEDVHLFNPDISTIRKHARAIKELKRCVNAGDKSLFAQVIKKQNISISTLKACFYPFSLKYKQRKANAALELREACDAFLEGTKEITKVRRKLNHK